MNPATRGGLALLALALGVPLELAAQGAGTAGAQVLQLPAGGRAAGLSGAYAAADGDADVVFYNPAGLASLQLAAGASYQRHVESVRLGSGAGALRLGGVVLGFGVAYLDAGDITVVEPDARFGGERGTSTGRVASAREAAARLAVAVPLVARRMRVGAAAGFVSSELDEVGRSAPVLDAGVQYLATPFLTIGAAVLNLGPSLSGDAAADAPLPTEIRTGVLVELEPAAGLGVVASLDLAHRFEEGATIVAAGLEAGLVPGAARPFGAVARIGYDAGTGGDGLGPLRLGGGVSLRGIAVDYTYQSLDFFGAVHRIGVRWVRLP